VAISFARRRQLSDQGPSHQNFQELGTCAAVVSAFIAGLVFSDRWRCIEATSSRYCSGVMNASILYVPIIAAAYALLRGAQKLWRR